MNKHCSASVFHKTRLAHGHGIFRLGIFVLLITLIHPVQFTFAKTKEERQAAKIAEIDSKAGKALLLPENAPLKTSPETRKLNVEIITTVRNVLNIDGKNSKVMGDKLGLDGALRDLNAEKTNLGTVINLASAVLFSFDKYDLRPDAESTLEKLLIVIQAQNVNKKIEIVGHTDSIGTDQYNQALSEKRAQSVANWLIAHKIAAKRLNTSGRGESEPVDTNETVEGRQKNRRVSITIPD